MPHNMDRFTHNKRIYKIYNVDNWRQNMQMENQVYDFYKNLDRSIFIDNENKKYANYDRPFPIGYEQTISQPSLVCEMTSILKLNKNKKVLEIGTGSGYQTAFLAYFAKEVYTVERIEELSEKAQKRLYNLGYNNIKFRIGDGSKGWNEYAPFERIIVTAGAGTIPEELINQLAPNGRLLVPVGKIGCQQLMLIEKDIHGKVKETSFGEVTFVELKGEYGWKN